MPNGNVHRFLTKTTQVISLPVFFYLDPVTSLGIHTGIALTNWINCDNDITTNRLGIFKYLGFNAYNQLISHRSGLRIKNWRNLSWREYWKLLFYSHCPITGTLLRFMIVLYLPLILLMLLSAMKIWLLWYLSGILVGMCLSDSVHIGADVVWSALKKAFPFLRRYDDNGFRTFGNGQVRKINRKGMW